MKCFSREEHFGVGDRDDAQINVFYSELLGRERPTSWGFDLAALYCGSRTVDGPRLIGPFSPSEIRAAVDGLDRNSAPGPDGLGPSFYQAAWPVVSTCSASLLLFTPTKRTWSV
jgi:hypothetical protein